MSDPMAPKPQGYPRQPVLLQKKLSKKKAKRLQGKFFRRLATIQWGQGPDGKAAPVAERINPEAGNLIGCKLCGQGGHTGVELKAMERKDGQGKFYFCPAHYQFIQELARLREQGMIDENLKDISGDSITDSAGNGGGEASSPTPDAPGSEPQNPNE